MNYHIATFRGETLVFSTAGLRDDANRLYSGTAIDPRDVVVAWYRSQGKKPKYVTCNQRAFGCWEIESDLKE